MVAGPSVTDWISALSTAAIGVLGLFVTLWQWRRSGFCPRVKARIDAKHQAAEVGITNIGRAAGTVEQVMVVGREGQVIEARYDGFPGEAFQAVLLPGHGSMRVIVLAQQPTPFPEGVRLVVDTGTAEPATLEPAVMPQGLGLYGLSSVLPPGTFAT